MALRTLNYGNYGILLIMGNAGFCPSTVVLEGLGKGQLQPLPPQDAAATVSQTPGRI